MNDARGTMLRGELPRPSTLRAPRRLGSQHEPQNVSSFNRNAVEPNNDSIKTRPVTSGEPSAKRRKLSTSDTLLVNAVTRAGDTQHGSASTPGTPASDVGSPSLDSPLEADEQTGAIDLKALLRPELPWFNDSGTVTKKKIPIAHDDSTVAFREKPPQYAPHFSSKQIAGYYPWTGTGPEDRINSETCKSGWYEKPQHSESQNAYATYPIALKNATKDLSQLSDFLTNALTIRQENSRFEVHGEFKPPPRVTLTDGKREAWLRDLSNNEVPLRRLGRTIPHGVRGKAALDQCLAKSVSLPRALWLVQCIGANELRGFRRKGISPVEVQQSEVKWIQDWTAEVISFFDDVLGRKGEDDWRAHLIYAIRLVQGLLKRHLLDSPALVAWLIKRLEATTIPIMPQNLLLIEVFWKPLTTWRKQATKVLKILTELHTLVRSVHQGTTSEPTADRLQDSVTEGSRKVLLDLEHKRDRLAKSFSTVFMQGDVTSLAESDFPDPIPEMMAISSRQQALFLIKTTNTPQEAETRCYVLLEKFDFRSNLDKLAASCWSLWHDQRVIARAIISWSISRYRLQPARVYIAARLLRLWSLKEEYEVTSLFCELLETTKLDQIDEKACFNLIAVLVRSALFDLPRYMQWLVVRGMRKDPMLHFMHRVLANVPIDKLSIQSRNLRSILLKNAAVPETSSKTLAKMHSLACDACVVQAGGSLTTLLECLLESDMSSLYAVVQTLTRQLRNFEDKTPTLGLSSARVTGKLTRIIEELIELLPDVHAAAPLLYQCIESGELEALTHFARLIAQKADLLAATASLEPLVTAMMHRLGDFTHRGPEEKLFITYLYDILCYLDATKAAERLLMEIKHCDIDDGIFGTSPISEEMAEAMEQSDTISWTKLEALLSSGTVMEKSTMEKVFNFLTSNLKSCLGDMKAVEQYGNALARLRTFNALYFTASLMNWLKSLVTSCSVSELVNLIRGLVATDCVTLRLILVTFTPGAELTELDGDKLPIIASALVAIVLGLRNQPTESSVPEKSRDYVRAHRIEHQRRQTLISDASKLAVLLEQNPHIPQDLSHESATLVAELISLIRASTGSTDIESFAVSYLKRSSLGDSGTFNPLQDDRQADRQAAQSLLSRASFLNLQDTRLKLRLTNDCEHEKSSLKFDPTLIDQLQSSGSNLRLLYQVLEGIAPEIFTDTHTNMMVAALSQFRGLRKNPDTVPDPQVDEKALHLFAPHADPDTTIRALLELTDAPMFKTPPVALNFALRVIAAHHKFLTSGRVPQENAFEIVRTLSVGYLKQTASSEKTLLLDLIAILSDCLTPSSLTSLIERLRLFHTSTDLEYDLALGRVLGYDAVPAEKAFLLVSDLPLSAKLHPELSLGLSSRQRKVTPYQLRRWEVISDAGTSTAGDTCIPLRYFGARKAVLDI